MLVQDENGLYGFIDQNGNYVIEPQFSSVKNENHPFSNGVAFVKEGGENAPKLWGLIDSSGNYIVEPVFSEVSSFAKNKLAYVQDGNSGLYRYIDPTGVYQIEPQFTETHEFVDDMAIVSRGYGYEYIDTSGTTIIPGNFEKANIFPTD